MVALAELIDDPDDRPIVTRDPADDYLVALARIASADALVSGDRDVLEATLPGLAVLSPREFIDRHLPAADHPGRVARTF